MTQKLDRVCVFDSGDDCPALPIVAGGGVARAAVWPGVGAKMRSMHRISLAPGSRTIELSHPMEAVYYILSGAGVVQDAAVGDDQSLIEGSMIFVEPNTRYAIQAGDNGLEVMGGPCPPDPSLYAHLQSGVPKDQGS